MESEGCRPSGPVTASITRPDLFIWSQRVFIRFISSGILGRRSREPVTLCNGSILAFAVLSTNILLILDKGDRGDREDVEGAKDKEDGEDVEGVELVSSTETPLRRTTLAPSLVLLSLNLSTTDPCQIMTKGPQDRYVLSISELTCNTSIRASLKKPVHCFLILPDRHNRLSLSGRATCRGHEAYSQMAWSLASCDSRPKGRSHLSPSFL